MIIRPEQPTDSAAIEALLVICFGPDRFKKTAYRFREGVAPHPDLSYVMEDETTGTVIGTIRYWPVMLPDGTQSLLLGPIAIDPSRQSEGMGIDLMEYSLEKAKALGARSILLVGDAPYYNRFGFLRENTLGITLPGWVDLNRFLGLEIEPGILKKQHGMLQKMVVSKEE
ncbi:MAG: N-acetyltransferase [Alphaproteobacteria bacterium]|nr:N-acetyltransferase [Alphaproteobacteria bacterium]